MGLLRWSRKMLIVPLQLLTARTLADVVCGSMKPGIVVAAGIGIEDVFSSSNYLFAALKAVKLQ